MKRKYKAKRSNGRDFFSKEHQNWSKRVRSRDGYQCQWPGCKSNKRLNAHHIKKWAWHPELRGVISNGITLCKQHHDAIWGKEDQYINMFMQIVSSKSELLADIKKEIALEIKDKIEGG
jgi:predicted restriction endonuclease